MSWWLRPAIHNAVIQATLRLEQLTFENKGTERYDEPDDILQGSKICGRICSVIHDDMISSGRSGEPGQMYLRLSDE